MRRIFLISLVTVVALVFGVVTLNHARVSLPKAPSDKNLTIATLTCPDSDAANPILANLSKVPDTELFGTNTPQAQKILTSLFGKPTPCVLNFMPSAETFAKKWEMPALHEERGAHRAIISTKPPYFVDEGAKVIVFIDRTCTYAQRGFREKLYCYLYPV